MSVAIDNDKYKPKMLIDHIDLFEGAISCQYLSPNEEDFLQGLQDKYDKFGRATYISTDQLAWLERIVERG